LIYHIFDDFHHFPFLLLIPLDSPEEPPPPEPPLELEEPPPVDPAAPAAFIAAPVAITVTTTILVASFLSAGDMSAPILPRAANAAPGFENNSAVNAAGSDMSST
jgi:hypothetical protein